MEKSTVKHCRPNGLRRKTLLERPPFLLDYCPMSNAPKALPVHTPMPQFSCAESELLVGGLTLSRLAARVGQTPFYAYDRKLLQNRVAELRAALPASIKLHYAMKANPMPAVVALMAGMVDGIDVASGGELKVALDAGADPHEVSFAGPGKRRGELCQAVAAGVLINIESFREVSELTAISAELTLPARIAVRVNPDFELKGSGMKMGGGPKQFGVDAELVPELLAEVGKAGLQFEGFHLFAGSQNLKAESICEAQQKSYELALRLAAHAPSPVKFLNLGGGFGIPYFPGEQRLDLASVGENLKQIAACRAGDAAGRTGHRTGALSGRRSRNLRDAGRRPQGFTRPNLSRCRWRPQPPSFGLRQLRAGNSQELPGCDWQSHESGRERNRFRRWSAVHSAGLACRTHGVTDSRTW
jgi:hypothetical protein